MNERTADSMKEWNEWNRNGKSNLAKNRTIISRDGISVFCFFERNI